ncbi:uncharacterized protein PODANS_6_2040 [Podospora anserina S mat+]|uniref:Glycoside Hydrolase Family 2 n=1 Tax=Podospora anserina (strain S / ATCC MYA-4624 / DSM 980 / FGSC 10383) TaxID=515849 RepID=B2B2U5_PODAN|nr:uncharacterized protein PODANS_6_2040 [Podospora anserina S mat+]CAP71431.1 unnamed protein product [Podospora anserina S mat+]CDP30829.1 Putative Glycoside Hydrolase Family 2 [Podospora anserina S mat+]
MSFPPTRAGLVLGLKMINNAWPSLHWNVWDYYMKAGGSYFGAKVGDKLVAWVHSLGFKPGLSCYPGAGPCFVPTSWRTRSALTTSSLSWTSAQPTTTSTSRWSSI